MYIFKCYTPEKITFNLPETQFTTEMVKKSDYHFQSILRSPHANKNAQEQFTNYIYCYTIRFKSKARAEKFYKSFKKHKNFTFVSYIIIREQTETFATHF